MICQKLKSKSGASLSIAMLVFLVCAVLGVVCVAAATASAGRLSKLAENDRRYYAVASAAELLAGELCPTQPAPAQAPAASPAVSPAASPAPVPVPITITRKLVEKESKVTTCSVDDSVNPPRVSRGTTVSNWQLIYTTEFNSSDRKVETECINPEGSHDRPTSSGAPAVIPVDPEGESGGPSFLTAAAIQLMFGNNNCNTDQALDYSFTSGLRYLLAEGDGYLTGDLKLTPLDGVSADDKAALTVEGSYRLYPDGTLAVYVANDNYTLIVTLVPKISEERSQTSEDAAPEISPTTNVNGTPCYTETRTRTTTTVVTSTISWSVDSIRKEVSSPNETGNQNQSENGGSNTGNG